MIPAGHERARRNLHGTWALRRSQPLVSLGISGLGRMVGPWPWPVNPGHPRNRAEIARFADQLSTTRPQRAARLAQSARPVAGSSALTWPSKLVTTRRPPTRSAAVTTSEWATRQATVPSASMANVSTSDATRTWSSLGDPSRRQDRRRRAMVPAFLPGRGLEAVGVEPVGDDQETRRVPVDAPADRR